MDFMIVSIVANSEMKIPSIIYTQDSIYQHNILIGVNSRKLKDSWRGSESCHFGLGCLTYTSYFLISKRLFEPTARKHITKKKKKKKKKKNKKKKKIIQQD